MRALRAGTAAAALLAVAACAPAPEPVGAPPALAPAAASASPAASAASPATASPATAPATPGQARWSVAGRGDVAPPAPPGDEASRPAAAVTTVEAYLAAVVAMFRSGDPAAFLAVTTPGCGCRSLVATARRLAPAGGIRGFDVQVSSLREVDSAGSVASVVLADYVIPAHTEPATPGHPAVHERGTRYTVEFYLRFRGGAAAVDRTLRMRTWPA